MMVRFGLLGYLSPAIFEEHHARPMVKPAA
jgi:hypothetical protein